VALGLSGKPFHEPFRARVPDLDFLVSAHPLLARQPLPRADRLERRGDLDRDLNRAVLTGDETGYTERPRDYTPLARGCAPWPQLWPGSR
jgi:hypothetical protein